MATTNKNKQDFKTTIANRVIASKHLHTLADNFAEWEEDDPVSFRAAFGILGPAIRNAQVKDDGSIVITIPIAAMVQEANPFALYADGQRAEATADIQAAITFRVNQLLSRVGNDRKLLNMREAGANIFNGLQPILGKWTKLGANDTAAREAVISYIVASLAGMEQ